MIQLTEGDFALTIYQFDMIEIDYFWFKTHLKEFTWQYEKVQGNNEGDLVCVTSSVQGLCVIVLLWYKIVHSLCSQSASPAMWIKC